MWLSYDNVLTAGVVRPIGSGDRVSYVGQRTLCPTRVRCPVVEDACVISAGPGRCWSCSSAAMTRCKPVRSKTSRLRVTCTRQACATPGAPCIRIGSGALLTPRRPETSLIIDSYPDFPHFATNSSLRRALEWVLRRLRRSLQGACRRLRGQLHVTPGASRRMRGAQRISGVPRRTSTPGACHRASPPPPLPPSSAPPAPPWPTTMPRRECRAAAAADLR